MVSFPCEPRRVRAGGRPQFPHGAATRRCCRFAALPLGRAVARAVERPPAASCWWATRNWPRGSAIRPFPTFIPAKVRWAASSPRSEHTAADWNLLVGLRHAGAFGGIPARTCWMPPNASGADALVPAGPSGRPEPLCAVYHRRAREPLERAFAAACARVAAALEGVRVVRVAGGRKSRLFKTLTLPRSGSAHMLPSDPYPALHRVPPRL